MAPYTIPVLKNERPTGKILHLAALLPVPGLADAVGEWVARPPPTDTRELAAWTTTVGDLSEVLRVGELRASGAHREVTGRIRTTEQTLVQIPGAVRGYLVAPEGHVLVDVDITSCHPSIAAVRSGDRRLAADAAHGVARILAAEIPELPKKAAKKAAIAMFNGQGTRGRARDLVDAGVPKGDALALSQRLGSWAAARWPVLHAGLASVRSSVPVGPGGSVEVPAMRLPHGMVDLPAFRVSGRNGRPKWNSVQYHLWCTVEAAIVDRALEAMRLLTPLGEEPGHPTRLAVPAYDGLLLCTPEPLADAVQKAVEDHMVAAAAAFGVPVRVHSHISRMWGAPVAAV